MQEEITKKRIWELDFLRGFAVACMIVIHACDFMTRFGNANIVFPSAIWYVYQYGGSLFILLSGVCIRFSRSSFKRGLIVFLAGVFLALSSYLVYYSGIEMATILMRFNILNLIGLCMMIYPLLKKIPKPVLVVIGIGILIAGYYVSEHMIVESLYLYPLGFRPGTFSDYEWRPILPNLGYFMMGMVIGPLIYKEKKSLIPKITEKTPVINIFCLIGRNSLQVYIIQFFIIYILVKLVY